MSEQDDNEELSLVDELGVSGLRDLLFGKHGKLFSAAGRNYVVAEVNGESLVMHPPDKPFASVDKTEEIGIKTDDRGILLDELGEPKRISGGKFNGDPLYVLGERDDTGKNVVAALSKDGKLQKLYFGPHLLTSAAAFKLRNKTHDGELSCFSTLGTTPTEDD